MSQLYGVDISQFQPNINWDQLNAAANFVIMRAAYGTITDPLFHNYQSQARSEAVNAGPLGIGYYYYAYPTLVDAVTSANYFADTVGPLREGEVVMLDLEGNIGGDPVGWSLAWLRQVEARMGAKPLIYLNQSEVKSYNWSPVINNGNGLWLAEYDGQKAGPGVTTPWPVTAVRQWTDADHVQGIPENVDGDTFYGDFNAWNAYGYHAPVASPPSAPAPQPEPTPPTPTEPTPPQPPTPVTPPAVTPSIPDAPQPAGDVPAPQDVPTITPAPRTSQNGSTRVSWLTRLIQWLTHLLTHK
jgi:GH25 family lysozyme M1 (1,4-beta-N-acetylmuramidase)